MDQIEGLPWETSVVCILFHDLDIVQPGLLHEGASCRSLPDIQVHSHHPAGWPDPATQGAENALSSTPQIQALPSCLQINLVEHHFCLWLSDASLQL